MGCCALGTCTDPGCRLCVVVAKLPQPKWTGRDRKLTNALRDGVAVKKGRDPVFTKRSRKALR
jgi:hypothetical protein